MRSPTNKIERKNVTFLISWLALGLIFTGPLAADPSGGPHHRHGHHAQVPQFQYAMLAAQYANTTKNYLDIQKQDKPRIDAANEAQKSYQDARAELEKAFANGSLHQEDRAEVENAIQAQLNGSTTAAPSSPAGSDSGSSENQTLGDGSDSNSPPVSTNDSDKAGSALTGGTQVIDLTSDKDPHAEEISLAKSGAGNEGDATRNSASAIATNPGVGLIAATGISDGGNGEKLSDKFDALSQSLMRNSNAAGLLAGAVAGSGPDTKKAAGGPDEQTQKWAEGNGAGATPPSTIAAKMAALAQKIRSFFGGKSAGENELAGNVSGGNSGREPDSIGGGYGLMRNGILPDSENSKLATLPKIPGNEIKASAEMGWAETAERGAAYSILGFSGIAAIAWLRRRRRTSA